MLRLSSAKLSMIQNSKQSVIHQPHYFLHPSFGAVEVSLHCSMWVGLDYTWAYYFTLQKTFHLTDVSSNLQLLSAKIWSSANLPRKDTEFSTLLFFLEKKTNFSIYSSDLSIHDLIASLFLRNPKFKTEPSELSEAARICSYVLSNI